MNNTLGIAKEALNNYSITCKSIDFIGQSANTIYKITDLKNESYSLRLHVSKSETLESVWTEQDVIRSEMVWLHSLALDTDLTLPSPIQNIRGEFITDVNNTSCTLVKWVEGEQKPFITTLDDEGLLQSYSKYHSLPDNYIELLEGFYIAGQLETINFWLGLPDSHEWLPNHIRKLANREVNAYVKKESFLFNGIPYWE